MKRAELYWKLIAAARLTPPSQEVPPYFRTRVMARLGICRKVDPLALWAQALWRAVAPCAAIMVILAAWGWFSANAAPPAGDLSQELENTLLAGADAEQSPDL